MRYRMIPLSKKIEVPKIATLFYMEYNSTFVFEGERHDFWEFIYCDRGEVRVTSDSREVLLKKGMIAFHKPNEFHTVEANKKIAPNIIVLSFLSRSKALDALADKAFLLTEHEKNLLGRIVREANEAFDIAYQGDLVFLDPKTDYAPFAGSQYIRNLVEIFLIELVRRQGVPMRSIPDQAKFTKVNLDLRHEIIEKKILDYFEAHLHEMVLIEDLCTSVAMSKSYVTDIFRKRNGKGIMTVFNEMKIEKAKELLRNHELNITQVSEALGFSSVHYFSRRFKQLVGMTPTEYITSIKIRSEKIK